jgi:hypothetical protein
MVYPPDIVAVSKAVHSPPFARADMISQPNRGIGNLPLGVQPLTLIGIILPGMVQTPFLDPW